MQPGEATPREGGTTGSPAEEAGAEERPAVRRPPDEAGSADPSRRGRAPAGTDPAKRRQILEGADRVFSTLGFDAASMNDIAREARVSKGTLYVYFQNKEELFTDLIRVKRHQHCGELFEPIPDDDDVRATLLRSGTAFTRMITSDWSLRALRVVMAVTERMPEVGRGFYIDGPGRGKPMLADYLRRMTERGFLKVDDPMLAAAQLGELCQANLVKPRLFRMIDEPPTEAEIARVVGRAVDMFLAFYGTGKIAGTAETAGDAAPAPADSE
ncbi:TetR/AcrR family transcriptional regulator [Rhodovulum sp. PH10]|uniref:TetR/AcrR family transcriptional regulator n=1 Tax=Rhodovulum sp. PH10 TaxID=1187851 RepID=UPI000A06FCB4|nr:TetR/AcrR family transcriptional regulator [Rhodovulum sp. PH10]